MATKRRFVDTSRRYVYVITYGVIGASLFLLGYLQGRLI